MDSGPYGITTGADGLVYIADTWNHRIVVVNTDGQVVRTFGQFGNNEDSPDPSLNPGSFYGPRGITIYNNEVYVTDTGNERVEVFGLDGTFVRSWGGTGSAPNQLLEPVGITVGSDGNVYVADSGQRAGERFRHQWQSAGAVADHNLAGDAVLRAIPDRRHQWAHFCRRSEQRLDSGLQH